MEAAKVAASSPNSTTQAAAIRRILPWRLVATHLRERFPFQPLEDTEFDIQQIRNDRRIGETTKKALIDARRGQGKFRANLERRWGRACAVTGCGITAILRASHIKRWADSSNSERLNPANGILLAAHLDALFDCGLISFADDGKILVSAEIASELKLFQLSDRLRHKPTKEERQFLAYHRRYVFSA